MSGQRKGGSNMIVVNYDNVTHVDVSQEADEGVTFHFVDGNTLFLFGIDAEKVKQDLRRLINTSGWSKVSYDEGE